MIIKTVKIKCDICGVTIDKSNYINDQIDGTTTQIEDLTNKGWLFRRDERNKLLYVLCSNCQNKAR